MTLSRHLFLYFTCLLIFAPAPGIGQSLSQHQSYPAPQFLTEPQLIPWLFREYPHLITQADELELTHRIQSPGGIHYTFRQIHAGIPVENGMIKVNLGHDGRIWSSSDASIPHQGIIIGDFSVDTSLLRISYGELLGAHTIRIFPEWRVNGGKLLPTFRLETHQSSRINSYDIWVDAQSGAEILREDRSAYHHLTQDSSGRGRVFSPDPCTRANLAYGSEFTDGNDLHTPVLEALMDTVILRDLTFEDDTFFLKGPFVQIQDWAPYRIPVATSHTGDFLFERSDPGFEEVMCYYHIDSYQRYIQTLGFVNLQNGPIRVDAHGKANSDQSSYTSDPNGGYLLFGDGGVDDGEDADVIIHEYGHALSESASPNSRSGTERRGLDEGIGDYFAASYSFDADIWRWYELFNWDGHNEYWDGRMGVSQRLYPPSNTSIYVYGEIWAATLMQIRQELGAEVTDRLVFQELYSNFPQMTLPDAAILMIQADSMLYQGVHTNTLIRYFCERNLLKGTTCSTVRVQSLDSPKAPTVTKSGHNTWELESTEGVSHCSVTDLTGRILLLRSFRQTSTLDLRNFPSGVYLLRIQSNNSDHHVKLRVIQ